MNKKIIVLIIIMISIATISIGCNKNNNLNKDDNKKTINYKNNPISEESALNVLKSEYGQMIITTIDDIKKDGENYVVDVQIESTVDEEEHNESKEHDHKESIGIHKINIYTGELTKPESKN